MKLFVKQSLVLGFVWPLAALAQSQNTVPCECLVVPPPNPPTLEVKVAGTNSNYATAQINQRIHANELVRVKGDAPGKLACLGRSELVSIRNDGLAHPIPCAGPPKGEPITLFGRLLNGN